MKKNTVFGVATAGVIGWLVVDKRKTVLDLPMQEGKGNTVPDKSWHGNHGIFGEGDAAPTWVQALSGQWLLSFDGGDYVDCGRHQSITTGPVELTVEALIYPRSWPRNMGHVVGNVWREKSGYGLMQWYNSFGFFLTDKEGHTQGAAGAQPPSNQWTWVVGTYKDNNLNYFVNGELVASKVINGYARSGNSIVVGARTWKDYGFDGFLRGVRILNRALDVPGIQGRAKELGIL